MAYTVKLGTFSKLENSTAQPTTTGWAEYSCVLKNGSDLINPVITLNVSSATAMGYNYATMFSRYYWISDIVSNKNDFCTIYLRLDIMATYKTEIGSTSLYVLRSASASDGSIVDKLYPTTSISYGYAEDDTFLPSSMTYNSGIYVVNVMGIGTTGNSTLWKLSPSDFRSFISSLYTNIDGFQFSDIYSAIVKLIAGGPEQLVSSAMWLPPYAFTTAAAEEIKVGAWESGVNGQLITDPIFDLATISLSIPKHPQASTRGSFLNLAPYSTYTLRLPLFGMVNIDTTAIKNSTTLSINISVDAVSGQARCIVTCDIPSGTSTPTPILADVSAQMGVPVPLRGQSSGASVAGSIVSTLAGTVGAFASGGASAILGAAASAAGTAITAMSGASCNVGSAGGALAAQYNTELHATFLHIADADVTHKGNLLYANRTISTLSGYIMVAEGDVKIPAPISVQEQLKLMLEAGFFYE